MGVNKGPVVDKIEFQGHLGTKEEVWLIAQLWSAGLASDSPRELEKHSWVRNPHRGVTSEPLGSALAWVCFHSSPGDWSVWQKQHKVLCQRWEFLALSWPVSGTVNLGKSPNVSESQDPPP